MKRCPKCQHTYTDETIKFCRQDGTPLMQGGSSESSATMIFPSASRSAEISTQLLANTPSIAVLPFVNMSADLENEYFCDGLAEELLNALSKVAGLKVAARTSAFSFKGKDLDIREIGHTLNVNTVLEGSVRKAGSRLRINAQLINVADGYHLWSEKYDRQMEDVFDIQDEISLAIVEALKVRLLGEAAGPVMKRHTVDVEAYQLYLKGRYFWNKRSEEGLKKAIEYFNNATERDNRYALAFAGLADCYTVLSMYGVLPPNKTYPVSKAAAMRALEIDNRMAEAHASLAFVMYRYDWDWQAAGREFRHSIELNPNYAPAYQWYASYLSALGQSEDALKQIIRARELDPLSLIINRDVGMILYWARQYDQAIEELSKTLQMERSFGPAYAFLGLAYARKGMPEQAIAVLEEGLQIFQHEPFFMAQLGHALALAGQKDGAQDIFGRLVELSKRRYVSPSYLAIVCDALGEKDQVFEWLERAYEQRDDRLVFIKVDPLSDNIRLDPRFPDLLRRLGLQPRV
jgi:TolB-like protein/Flp pilus assembly protein TadD